MVFPENENSNSAEEKKSLNEDFHNETALDENLDDSKAKFLGNGNNDLHHDPHVVIELGSDIAFTGLGKEELMKYAEDPFWIRTRMILFIIFWVGWLAMLVAAILIIVFAPKCPERPDMKWYQTDIVYQINPKSFKDTSAKDVEGDKLILRQGYPYTPAFVIIQMLHRFSAQTLKENIKENIKDTS